MDQWLPGARRRGSWGVNANGYGFFCGSDENVLELESGDGYIDF